MLIALLVFGPFAGGLLSWLLGRRSERARDLYAVLFTAAELLFCLLLFGRPAALSIDGILAGGLHFQADGFRRTYAAIAAFMWAFTAVFAQEYFAGEREHLNRYWLFMIVTLGATEGVFLSADLMTAFVFFEVLSFTSFTWVIHEETEEAVRAGYTYLFIAVIGGLILFMGLLMLQEAAGTLEFSALREAAAAAKRPGMVLAAGICILLGFGAKAGMVPLHVWLPKAHPVAPSPASALLSGILTKVGIYGILMTAATALAGNRAFGLAVLVSGSLTMALGAVLALFSVNLKRTLACSSMSQIGFILTGTAMMVLLTEAGSEEGAAMALCGLMLHMVNHSLIKLTLFMAAGAVVMNLHALDLNAIRGWGRNKPFLKISFALGALGISGVPLFNGYISKTLLHESIVEGIHGCAGIGGLLSVLEWVFLISGGLTFAYMLKLFGCLFVEKNADAARQQAFDASARAMNPASTAVVFGSSLLMAVLGQPAVSTRLAAFMSGFPGIRSFAAFSPGNLKGGLISLGIGTFVYLVIVRRLLMEKGAYVNRWPAWLDLEELLYRPLLTRRLPAFFGAGAALFGENRLLRPLFETGLPELENLQAFLGENRGLARISRAVLFAGTVFGRTLELGMDGVAALLRATLLKERKIEADRSRPGLVRIIFVELEEAGEPIISNFTTALFMTCIGILVVLLAVIFGS